MKLLLLLSAFLVAACTSAWEPVPLGSGYQVMVMNSKEVYVANSDRELLLGPTIESIGIADGIIIVDCGPDERTVNGFANTVGLNLIDTKTGTVLKGLTSADVAREVAARHQASPEMFKLSAYLK